MAELVEAAAGAAVAAALGPHGGAHGLVEQEGKFLK